MIGLAVVLFTVKSLRATSVVSSTSVSIRLLVTTLPHLTAFAMSSAVTDDSNCVKKPTFPRFTPRIGKSKVVAAVSIVPSPPNTKRQSAPTCALSVFASTTSKPSTFRFSVNSTFRGCEDRLSFEKIANFITYSIIH